MFRKVAFVAAAVAAITLAGCNATITGNAQVDALINQAMAYAKQACGVEVTAANIVKFVPLPVGNLPSYIAIANKICAPVLASKKAGGKLAARLAAGQSAVVQINVGGSILNLTVHKAS